MFLHTVHCVIFKNFTINIGIGTYFIYCKYINPSIKVVNNKERAYFSNNNYKMQFYETNKWEKSKK